MAAQRSITIACTIRGPIAPSDVRGIGARIARLVEKSHAEALICNLDAFVDPDLVTVDAVARARLEARRLGCAVRLHGVSRALHELLELVGLEELVLCVETKREPEQRKELLRIEEEGELADTSV